jgi:hypothetical protein
MSPRKELSALRFSLDELKEKVAHLPQNGYYELAEDQYAPALFYHFRYVEGFEISLMDFEYIDIDVSREGTGSWATASSLGELDEINLDLKNRRLFRMRYVVLCL